MLDDKVDTCGIFYYKNSFFLFYFSCFCQENEKDRCLISPVNELLNDA